MGEFSLETCKWVLSGLQEIFEELKSERMKPEGDLKAMLVEKAGRKNYIASSGKQEYERARFREFKNFLSE